MHELVKLVDTASSHANDNDTLDEFDKLLSKIKGVGAMVSNEFLFLGGKKADVMKLKMESEKGKCSLYTTLVENPQYNEHVKSYWKSIESAVVLVPKGKKLALKMLNDKSAPDLENPLLVDGVALLEECNAHIRPGQAAKLQQAVLLKVSALCTAITNGTLLCGSADIHRVVVLLGRAEDAYGQKIESTVDAVDTLHEAATVELAAERLSKFMEDCATLQKAITASTSCFGLSKVLLSNLFTKPAVDPIGKASIAYPAVTVCLNACFLMLANSEENAEDLALDTKATGCISDLLDVTSNLVATLADDVALVFSEKREPFVEMKASYDTLVLFFQLGPSAEYSHNAILR